MAAGCAIKCQSYDITISLDGSEVLYFNVYLFIHLSHILSHGIGVPTFRMEMPSFCVFCPARPTRSPTRYLGTYPIQSHSGPVSSHRVLRTLTTYQQAPHHHRAGHCLNCLAHARYPPHGGMRFNDQVTTPFLWWWWFFIMMFIQFPSRCCLVRGHAFSRRIL